MARTLHYHLLPLELRTHRIRRHIDNNTLPTVQQLGDWNDLIPRKANILAWRLAHGRLPTKVNLAKRGIGVNKECTLCNIDEETEEHLFLNCPVTKEVWNDFRCWWQGAPQTPNSINDLVKWRGAATKMQDEIQAAVFLVFLWVVWVHMNKKAHSSNLMSHKGLANEIKILSHLWINARIRRKKIDWRSWCADPKQVHQKPSRISVLSQEWMQNSLEMSKMCNWQQEFCVRHWCLGVCLLAVRGVFGVSLACVYNNV
ncbi:hypothetical protein LXL04_012438 [Taraxacum kok-saghyz]